MLITSITAFSIFYRMGFFHPKYFVLNSIKINAPTGTYLYSVSVDQNNIFDLFSPLKFSMVTAYTLQPKQDIDILFFNPNNNKILNIIGEESNLTLFKKYISETKKIEALNVKLLSYKNCNKIYQYEDGNIKTFLFFNSQKHISFSLSTNINEAADINIARLCEGGEEKRDTVTTTTPPTLSQPKLQ